MKEVILSLMVFLGTCLGTQAQLPTEKIEEGNAYYMCNADFAGFLTGGNKWGTQASLGLCHGNKVILKKYLSDDGKWDGETYYMCDSILGEYKNIFIEEDGEVYVDQAESTKERDNLWSIKESAKGIYHIRPSVNNKHFNSQHFYFSAKFQVDCKQPLVGLFEPCDSVGVNWSFVEVSKLGLTWKIFPKRVVPIGEKSLMKWYIQEDKQLGELDSIVAIKQSIMDDAVEAVASTKILPEKEYYLYNRYTGLYLSEDTEYGWISHSEYQGLPIVLRKFVDANKGWDGISYTVRGNNSIGETKYLYFSKKFIDISVNSIPLGSDSIFSFTPSKGQSGAYKIGPSQYNKCYTPDNMPQSFLGNWGFLQENNVERNKATDQNTRGRRKYLYNLMRLQEYLNGEERSMATDWLLIPKGQRNLLYTAQRRQDLFSLTNSVSLLYPNMDLTSMHSLYSDINSKDYEVENAIYKLKCVLDGKQSTVVDYTTYIKNQNFDENDGKGWDFQSLSNSGRIVFGRNNLSDTLSNPCAEVWTKAFDLSQELYGLPNGLYRLDVQAFSRPSIEDIAWLRRNYLFIVPVIYTNDVELPVENLMKTSFPNKNDYRFLQGKEGKISAGWLTMEGTYVPDNLNAAAGAFRDGYYNNSLYVYVSDHHLKLGIKELYTRLNSWTAWDNFRLTNLQETVEHYVAALTCHLGKAKELNELALNENVESVALNNAIMLAEKKIAETDKEVLDLRQCLDSLCNEIKRVRDSFIQKEFMNEQMNNLDQVTSSTMQEENENKIDSSSYYNYVVSSFIDLAELQEKINPNKAKELYLKGWNVACFHSTYDIDRIIGKIVEICIEKAEYAEALKLIQRVYDFYMNKNSYSDSGILNTYIYKGEVLFAKKDYKQALQAFQTCVSLFDLQDYNSSDQVGRACKGLAFSLAHLRRYVEAVSVIDDYILKNTDRYDIYKYYLNKGEILFMSGDREGALAMWDNAVEMTSLYQCKDENLYKLLFPNGDK